MPVVISEVEIAAGESAAAQPGAGPATPVQPRLLDLEREIERVGRVRSEREQRLGAD